jgi:ABC-2 type transport system permease protein
MVADTLTPPRVDRTRLPVLRWVLREQRRSLVLWAFALAGVSAMYLSFYPAMGGNEDIEAMVEGLPEALQVGMGWDRIGTAAGYLESTVYGLIAPALLLVFAVSVGARLLAGEEEAGTLELESAGPVSRRGVLLQRFAAVALGLALLCAVLGAATLVLVPALEMDVAAGGILAATLGLWLFALAMGTIAFAVGAVTGRRAPALAVAAGVAVLAYVANALAPSVEGAAWLDTVSPFSWYLGGDPLVQGVDPAGFGALLALILAALVVGLVRFDRRDLGV